MRKVFLFMFCALAFSVNAHAKIIYAGITGGAEAFVSVGGKSWRDVKTHPYVTQDPAVVAAFHGIDGIGKYIQNNTSLGFVGRVFNRATDG